MISLYRYRSQEFPVLVACGLPLPTPQSRNHRACVPIMFRPYSPKKKKFTSEISFVKLASPLVFPQDSQLSSCSVVLSSIMVPSPWAGFQWCHQVSGKGRLKACWMPLGTTKHCIIFIGIFIHLQVQLYISKGKPSVAFAIDTRQVAMEDSAVQELPSATCTCFRQMWPVYRPSLTR